MFFWPLLNVWQWRSHSLLRWDVHFLLLLLTDGRFSLTPLLDLLLYLLSYFANTCPFLTNAEDYIKSVSASLFCMWIFRFPHALYGQYFLNFGRSHCFPITVPLTSAVLKLSSCCWSSVAMIWLEGKNTTKQTLLLEPNGHHRTNARVSRMAAAWEFFWWELQHRQENKWAEHWLGGLCWRHCFVSGTRGPEVNWGVCALFGHLLLFVTASKSPHTLIFFLHFLKIILLF